MPNSECISETASDVVPIPPTDRYSSIPRNEEEALNALIWHAQMLEKALAEREMGND